MREVCGPSRTWNDIAGIHGILVFDEAKAIHELDLGNLTSAMSLEVRLDVGLCRVAREVPEIEAGGGDFRHFGGYARFLSGSPCLVWEVSAVLNKQRPCGNQNAKGR